MARSLGGTLALSQEIRTRARARRAFLRLDLWRAVVVLGLLCLGILFYVWQHIQVVRLGYEIEHLQAERLALVRQENELRFEVARLRSLRRVEEIGRRQLGLTSPVSGQVILVE